VADVVSGLLAKLERLEAMAREAAKYSASSWRSPSSAVVDLGTGDLDALVPVPASPIAYLMVDHDPDSVLRLCRAHRDIVNAYGGALFTQGCHPEYEDNNGYVQAMHDTLRILARGLGAEEQSSE
jgi:hypothetical protein